MSPLFTSFTLFFPKILCIAGNPSEPISGFSILSPSPSLPLPPSSSSPSPSSSSSSSISSLANLVEWPYLGGLGLGGRERGGGVERGTERERSSTGSWLVLRVCRAATPLERSVSKKRRRRRRRRREEEEKEEETRNKISSASPPPSPAHLPHHSRTILKNLSALFYR